MWFFQPIELNKKRQLLFRVLCISLSAHAALLLAIFLEDFFSAQALVLQGRGARVSMKGARTSSESGGPASLPQTAIQPPVYSQLLAQTEAKPLNNASQDNQEKKAVVETKEAQKPKQKVEKKKAEKKEVAKPTLKQDIKPKVEKKEKSEAKKEKVKPVPEVATKKEIASQNIKEAQTKEMQKAVQRTVTKMVEPKQQASVVTNGAANDAKEQGSGNARAVGSGKLSAGSAERVEFDAEEATGSENGIVAEIVRHYRRPPGFDDHETFTFTFEIRNGKAVAFGPKGTEPLVIYSAVKDAVMRSTFPFKQKKIELIINPSG